MAASDHPSSAHPVARTVTFDDNGHPSTRSWVLCPRTHSSVPHEQCTRCELLALVVPGNPEMPDAVVCAVPKGEASDRPGAERALRLPRLSVSDLMTRNVVCVRMHLSLDAVAQLFLETGLHSVPVVDEHGRVLGTVSNEDVQLDIHAQHAPGDDPARPGSTPPRSMEPHGRSVADVMLPLPFTIQEDASVMQAAALLVVEALDRVAVVSGGGEVVGIIAASDILHWLAREDGFVLPLRRE